MAAAGRFVSSSDIDIEAIMLKLQELYSIIICDEI
jgi:hypothetical protein